MFPIFFIYFNKVFAVKPVLSDHIKQDIFLAIQAGGCLLLHESRAQELSALLSFSNKQPPVYSDYGWSHKTGLTVCHSPQELLSIWVTA